MIALSELRRFHIVDDGGHRVPLWDETVDLAAGDYPPVTRLLYRDAQKPLPGQEPAIWEIPWKAVRRVDTQRHAFEVQNLGSARRMPAAALEQAVLLKRDIQDALIIDVRQLYSTRATDLWLEEEDGQLWLRYADISPWAVLRRLSGGRTVRQPRRGMYDWKYLEFLRGDPQAARRGHDYHYRISHLPPGEIALLLDGLPYLHAAELLMLLPDKIAADTLEVMMPERQLQVFQELDEAQAVRLLNLMRPDSAADLLGWLGPEETQRFLHKMPRERADLVIDLLRYPEDTAGGIMDNDVVVARASLWAGDARDELRDQLGHLDFVHDIYVVEDKSGRKLLGMTTLRDIFIADPERTLGELMNPYLITLYPLQPAEDAAERVVSSGLAALPVVTHEGRLVGALTLDAALAQTTPQIERQSRLRFNR